MKKQSWFSQTGYPHKLIKTENSKVKFSGQSVFHRTNVEKGVPLLVTYQALLKSNGKIIYDNISIIYE